MSESIGWGIVGTGKIARILARALAESAGGELVAVASRSSERAEAFASQFPVRRRYDDYADLLDDPDVRVVYIATHHPAHREWATKAANAGKHLLCEKPLAVHRGDAQAIVDAARRNGVFLMEAFAYRCHPQTRKLVQLLQAGAIGDVRLIDAAFGYNAGPQPSNYLLDRRLGGGSILDVGCYTTSMAHLVAGACAGRGSVEAVDVSGAGVIGTSSGVDHYAAATIAFEGGLVARVACAIQVNLESSVRIFGSEGWIAVPSPWLPGRIGSRSVILIHRPGAEPEEIDVEPARDLYTIEVDAVGTSIFEGVLARQEMPWEESLANMNTLDRWRESIGLRYPAEIAGAAGTSSGR